jgi:hypothetical protein
MKRSITALLLATCCFALLGWAQAPEGQNANPPAQAERKPAAAPRRAEINPPADPNAPKAQFVEITEFPLDKFKDFSAIENGSLLPGFDTDVHIYRSGNLMRTEGSLKAPSYYVTDLAKRKSSSVTSRTCLNMHVAYARTFPFFVPEEGARYEIAPAGEATVDGHHCKLEDIRIHRLKRSEVPEFRLYEAEDLDGFPIKIENRRPNAYHWIITYKDVHLEPQDSSLFIVPEKCASDADWKQLGAGAKTKTAPKKTPGETSPSKPSQSQQNDSQKPPQ